MLYGEDEEYECNCDPCNCETPGEMSPTTARSRILLGEDELEEEEGQTIYHKTAGGYQLDEFVRAKEYFMTASTRTGISLYDHLSELIRKLLDTRNPPNAVDFVEEISMNIKRYRFGMKKDFFRDASKIPGSFLKDSKDILDSWRRHALWSLEQSKLLGEDMPSFGGFPNLMRLLYYLEQVNVGLPKEEMLRIALAVRQLIVTRPVYRARFWGKIIGLEKNYYIVEAEPNGEDVGPFWTPPPSELEKQPAIEGSLSPFIPEYPSDNVLGAGQTFQRAGHSVLDPDYLASYQETSGLPPEVNAFIVPRKIREMQAFAGEYYGEDQLVHYADPESLDEQKMWLQFQNELMTGFPVPEIKESIGVPSEPKGTGVNRRRFYVCNDLGDDWLLLPDVTPQQINGSRKIRWFLTGNLYAQIKTYPSYPGVEGQYLKALLARITAGAMISPRGYFKTKRQDAEFEGEDEEEIEEEEEEEDERIGNDTVYPVRKYRPPPMVRLLSPAVEFWVHHTGYILRQGRNVWWNPPRTPKQNAGEEEDDEYLEEEEEEDGTEGDPNREIGPSLLSSLAEDKTLDGITPWSTRASSTVFTEFQVASVRSNLWPGATAMCTIKGKVENIYIGDGLKFAGRTYSPDIPEETASEYVQGPELDETIDPTAEEEEKWLAKVQLKDIADVEEPFVDNEGEDASEEEGEDEETEDEDD